MLQGECVEILITPAPIGWPVYNTEKYKLTCISERFSAEKIRETLWKKVCPPLLGATFCIYGEDSVACGVADILVYLKGLTLTLHGV